MSQESPPSLGRGLPVLRHEAENPALGNLQSQFEQFPVNALAIRLIKALTSELALFRCETLAQ
jgi:hypothetical protein